MKVFLSACFAFVSFASNSQNTLILNPDKDVSIGYHYLYNDGTVNAGDAVNFAAYEINGTSGGENLIRGLISFDLSTIPSGSIVQSAKINFYAFNAYPSATLLDQGHCGQNSCYLRRTTSDWTEFGATWVNKPATTTDNEVILPQSTSPNQDYLDLDVTQLIQFYIDNPLENHGMMLGLVNEAIGNNLSFHSRDSNEPTKRPWLEVTYLYPVGIQEVLKNTDLSISQNPVENSLTLQTGENKGQYDVHIYDLSGQLTLNYEKMSGESITLDVSSLKTGTYFIEMTGTIQRRSMKFVKK